MDNPIKVLLVDDDDDVRFVTATGLEARGYTVIHASSGDAAVAILESERVDIAISDLMMPNGNGLKVRDCAKRLGVPLIFITGFEGPYADFIEKSTTTLAKPFNIEDLLAAVEAYCPAAVPR